MEEINEYLRKCKIKPGWVKDKDDAMKYAAHIAHRLYQARKFVEVYGLELQRIHPQVHNDAWDKAQKESDSLDEIWAKDTNHSNFTDWTPTKSLGELYPEYAKPVN